MKIEIKVSNYGDDRPYVPGTAYVFIDGTERARLRASESYTIETTENYATRFVDLHKS